MDWEHKKYQPAITVVSAESYPETSLSGCMACDILFCPERSVTVTGANPDIRLRQEDLAKKIGARFIAQCNDENARIQVFPLKMPACQKASGQLARTVAVEGIGRCDATCALNRDISAGHGTPALRDKKYACSFRDENHICGKFTQLNKAPLTCEAGNGERGDCPHHEKAYVMCRQPGKPCRDLRLKYGAPENQDALYFIAHEISATPCRFLDIKSCAAPDCPHQGEMCTMEASGETCASYRAADGYSTGVHTIVRSVDGKDDRKIFNSGSSYPFRLDPEQKETLRAACRISRRIAAATGLKCNGVRRSISHPFVSNDNALGDRAIVIEYLYITNPGDCLRYDADKLSQAVYEALTNDCEAIGCEETEICSFNC
ncbi:MAG: hypothetical protein K6F98_05260 [Bacteroidales bacterium]|nr:hypothetical protein [Bacteroidales bacterium]